MKKQPVFKIILIIVAILVVLLITTLFYRIYQVKNFQGDLRPITAAEKQDVIQILNQNVDTTGYDISFGNVYIRGNERLVQVQLKKDNMKKIYSINLDKRSLVRDKNEK